MLTERPFRGGEDVAGLEPNATPEEIGLDAQRLRHWERVFDAHIASGRYRGTLTVIFRGGRIGYVRAAGARDAEADLPVEPDTIWRIYSMTKPITSVAAMMLCEEGALTLGDPVAKYIPAFADVRVYGVGPARAPATEAARTPITIWNLLTHTSGLTYWFHMRDPVDEMYRMTFQGGHEEPAPTLAAFCDRLATLPLLFQPGSEWNYSNSTDVLARVVEVASGQPFDRFLAEHILGPLGMNDTGYAVAEADAERLATLYAPDLQTGRARAVRGMDSPRTQPRAFHGGGHGLVSTAADYLRFARMLLGRGQVDGVRILAPHTADLMVANHLPGGVDVPAFARRSVLSDGLAGSGFGLGLCPVIDPTAARSPVSRGAYTWGGAAGTDFWVDPTEDLIVLFFTQVLFAPDAAELRRQLRWMVYSALVG
jgi:CubicO group peptidase (beta-lactamase class C family)